MKSDVVAQSVVLTDQMDVDIEWADGMDPAAFEEWFFFQESVHTMPKGRPGYIVMPGAKVFFHSFEVPATAVGVVTYGAGLPEISSDGLEVHISFIEADTKSEYELLRGVIREFNAAEPWFEKDLDLGFLQGRVGRIKIECLPGPDSIPDGDWLELYELVVSTEEEFCVNRARAFRQFKLKNELTVMSDAYAHTMFTGLEE